MIQLTEELEKARKAASLSQEALATQAGLSRMTVQRIESGQIDPRLSTLLEILMRDKSWNEELARKTYIAILDLIEPPKVKVADGQIPPDDPLVATYRRRLSSVVLS